MIRRYFSLRFGTEDIDELYHLFTGTSTDPPLVTEEEEEEEDPIVLQGHRISTFSSMDIDDSTASYDEYVKQQDQRLSSLHSIFLFIPLTLRRPPPR